MNAVIDKTLIIRLSSIGDIVLLSPMIRALRRRFPQGHLDVLVKAGYADLVRYNPHVSRVIEFPDNSDLSTLFSFRRMVREVRYDLVVDVHDSIRSRVLCSGSRSVVRIKKRKLARFALVHWKLNLPHLSGGFPPVAERYLETVKRFGVEDDGVGLDLFIPREVEERVALRLESEGLKRGDSVIGVAPSARHNTKIWNGDRFAKAAATLAIQHQSAVMLFGGNDDVLRCTEVAREISREANGVRVINLAGRTSLLESAAAMDYCRVVLCNDSGLMHIAAARKKSVVAIFGSTVKELGFFPYRAESTVVENSGLPCRPCSHIGLPSCPKKHFRCMNDITVDRVVDAVRQMMEPAAH